MSPPTNERAPYIQQETRFKGRYARSLANTLHQAYRPFALPTIAFLLSGFLGRLALLSNANLVGLWVDSLCRPPAICRPVPWPFAGMGPWELLQLMALATAVGLTLTLLFRVGISRISADAVSSIYDETTLRTSRLPMSFFDRTPAGRVVTRFSSDYNNIFRIFGGPLAEFLGLVFDLLAMTVLITWADSRLLPFWMGMALLNFLVWRLNLESLRVSRRDTASKRSPSIAHFAETAQGRSVVRAFGKEANFLQRFSALNDAFLAQRLVAMGAFTRFSLGMNLATASSFLVLGLLGAWAHARGELGVGSLGVAFTYFGLAATVLTAFFEWLGQFEDAMAGLERMEEYMRMPLAPGERLPLSAQFKTGHPVESEHQELTPMRGAGIHIQDLWMHYGEDGPAVLSGINLEVAPGEKLGIIGRTGSGKTSLVQALFRLYPLARGSVRVGGLEAEMREEARGHSEMHTGLERYRAQMAYITQAPALFVGTVRDNLSIAREVDDLPLAQALERVSFLPDGAELDQYLRLLDHPIEEQGRNLSAGERQLLCMARCLLQDAPVVILDEATSAVDPRSEDIMLKASEEFFNGKTQLIIAHRLSTVRACDRVLWLHGGKVRRLGTPSEVLPEFEASDLEALSE